MGRQAEVFYDKRAGCWGTSALGEMRVDAKGKRYKAKVFNRELTHPTKHKRAAQEWLINELAARRVTLVSVSDPTVEQLVEYYLQDAQSRLGPEAYDRAVEQLQRFTDYPRKSDPNRMGLRYARTITKGDVEGYRDALSASGLSASYVTDSLLKTLKACFRWGATIEPGKLHGLPLAYPFLGLKGPVVQRRKARAVEPLKVSRFLRWAWRETLKLSDGANRRHAQSAMILFMTLRDTGARPKDLCVAERDEWKVLGDGWGIIRLPAWKWKNGWKTGEERVIAVPPHCAKRIDGLLGLEHAHPTRIFTQRVHRTVKSLGNAKRVRVSTEFSLRGDPWTWLDHEKKRKGSTRNLQQWFNRLRAKGKDAGYDLPEGFRLYFHRSYYTTAARRRGVNDVSLAKSLGTSVQMLDRNYTDLDESDILGVAKAAAARPVKRAAAELEAD